MAIIDNGVDRIRTNVKTMIAKGISFVSADQDANHRILPWWMVADPHGTQMASLVAQANNYCRLYIARVGKGRKDILPEHAAKVSAAPVSLSSHISEVRKGQQAYYSHSAGVPVVKVY